MLENISYRFKNRNSKKNLKLAIKKLNEDRAWEQNPDGTWSWAVPLPFYGIRKGCQCGKKFWKISSYIEHYKTMHTDGLAYNRSPAGMMASYRTHRGTENKENYYG